MSSRERKLGAAAIAASLALAAAPAATPSPHRPPLVRLTFVEPAAEVAPGDGDWKRALEGSSVSLGETLRLGPSAVARLELPWMALTLSSGARLRLPDAPLLSAVLESGRALIESDAYESVKVVTREAEVRGRGRAVVRRREQATLVTCLAGRFRVAAAGGSVLLLPGQGSISLAGHAPGPPTPAPAAPDELSPGRDPVYAGRGEPITLHWAGDAPAYQVELLPVGSDVVLLERDVTTNTTQLEIPWHGAFRWRVSACNSQGLEGPPSEEGEIAVE